MKKRLVADGQTDKSKNGWSNGGSSYGGAWTHLKIRRVYLPFEGKSWSFSLRSCRRRSKGQKMNLYSFRRQYRSKEKLRGSGGGEELRKG